MMQVSKAVSPAVGVVLMVGLTVALFAGFTYISGGVANDQEGDIDIPNVETNVTSKQIQAELLENKDSSEVWIRRPDQTTTQLKRVGKEYSEPIVEDNKGEYQLLAYGNQTGDVTLIESIGTGEVPQDNVGELLLEFVPGSAETTGAAKSKQGPGSTGEGVSFLVNNTGDVRVDIAGYRIEEVSEQIEVETSSPPSKEPYEVDVDALSTSGEDGFCSRPASPNKDIPLNQDATFSGEYCQSHSTPSVVSENGKIDIALNGVSFEDGNRDINYFSYSPVSTYTDVRVDLFGPQYERLEIPFVFNMLIIPEDGSTGKVYPDDYTHLDDVGSDLDIDEDHPEIDPDAGPETILVMEDTRVKSDVEGDDIDGPMNMILQDGVTIESDIESVGAVSGGDDIVLQDVSDVTDVFLGDRVTIEDVDTVGNSTIGSINVGKDSTISQVDTVSKNVRIGRNSEITSDLEEIGGDAILKDNTAVEDVDEIGGSVTVGDDSVLGNVDTVGGSLSIGDNSQAGDIDSIEKGVTIGDNSQVNDINGQYSEDSNKLDGDLTVGDDSVIGDVDGVEGNLTTGNNVSTGNINEITGNVILGRGTGSGDSLSVGTIQTIDGDLIVGKGATAQDVNGIDGDVKVREDGVINGNLQAGDNGHTNLIVGQDATVKSSVSGVDGNIKIKNGGSVEGDISIGDNADGNLVIGENATAENIDGVKGDAFIKDNGSINGNLNNVKGDVICGDDVHINGGESCDETGHEF